MNNDITPKRQEERELQRVFDQTAAHPSQAQLARMLARSEKVPTRKHGKYVKRYIPAVAAAVLWLSLGGAAIGLRSGDSSAPVASSERLAASLHAVASGAPEVWPEEQRDSELFPTDPLAALDDDYESVWMNELDVLHGSGTDDDAFWEEMERILEEGG